MTQSAAPNGRPHYVLQQVTNAGRACTLITFPNGSDLSAGIMFGAGRTPNAATVINWIGRDLGLTYKGLGRPVVIAACVRQHRALAIIDVAGVAHAFGYRANGTAIPLQPLETILANDTLRAFAYELGEDRATYSRIFAWTEMLDHLADSYWATEEEIEEIACAHVVLSLPVPPVVDTARLKKEAMEQDLAARAVARNARIAARAALAAAA